MTSDSGNMSGKTSGSSMETGMRTAERAKVAVAKQSMLRASLHAQICQGPRPEKRKRGKAWQRRRKARTHEKSHAEFCR